MKFCKNLQRIVEISNPEWVPFWTNYKMLKKVIKELPSLVPVDDVNGTIRSSSPDSIEDITAQHDSTKALSDDPTASKPEPEKVEKAVLGKNPGEITFFNLLTHELKKATKFFESAQQEFSLREERVKGGMDITTNNNSNCTMVNTKWTILATSIYRLYKDLLLLETYAIMTFCAFSKILKKHDKVTGYQTRQSYMNKFVNKANFTHYPDVLAMISRCELMFEEVEKNLREEESDDTGNLCEEERLFIDMVHRLNGQIFSKWADGDLERRKDGRAMRQSIASTTSLKVQRQTNECQVTSSLRSLVEENESVLEHNPCLSDDPEEDQTRKTSIGDQSCDKKRSPDSAISPQTESKKSKML